MSDTPDEQEAPRLQDTTERAALPLPLPEGGAESAEPAPDQPAPIEEPAAETPPEDPLPPDPAPLPEPDPIREPQPDPDPAPEPPPPAAGADGAAAEGNGAAGSNTGLPPFQPAPSVADIGASEGPPLELLVGAAFVGGLALAFLIKRLGS